MLSLLMIDLNLNIEFLQLKNGFHEIHNPTRGNNLFITLHRSSGMEIKNLEFRRFGEQIDKNLGSKICKLKRRRRRTQIVDE